MEDTNTAVKSADRVLDLFELLAKSGQGLSHTEIADALQIPKSSLTKILRNLTDRDYVVLSHTRRGYILGPALVNLSQAASNIFDLATVAETYTTEVTRRTQESCAYNQLQGDTAEVVATTLGSHRLVTHMKLGDRAPLYATSGGKAILAYAPGLFRQAYLERVVFQAFTTSTIDTIERLLTELADVKEKGFGYSYEEYTPGIIGVGVPILTSNGVSVGSLNVAIPTSRFNRELKQLVEQSLQQAGKALQRHISAS